MAYDFKNKRVLVVDDDKTMKVILANIFKALKVKECLTAQDGKQGFEIFTAHKPDIVITDLDMDKADGIALTKAIRAAEREKKVMTPILLMSGHTDMSIIKKALDAGVTELLSKPFSVNDLAKRVAYVFSKPRACIEAGNYYGPDRRRKDAKGFEGPDKRKGGGNG